MKIQPHFETNYWGIVEGVLQMKRIEWRQRPSTGNIIDTSQPPTFALAHGRKTY